MKRKDRVAMQHRIFNKFGIFQVLATGLLLALALAACTGGSSNGDDGGAEESRPQSEAAYDGANSEPSDNDDAEALSGAGEVAEEDQASGSLAPEYVVNQVPFDRLIIRTVRIELTVEDVAQGSNWVRDLASRRGGFIFSSNTYVHDESEFAEMTIRVPADQLDSTVGELRDHDLVIQVDSEESSSQDVSQEYVDNESRLEALEETQRRFLALLSEAETVEEILRIESELTNIRAQIETIKGRQNYLDQMTSLSTITVTMHAENADFEDDDEGGFIARIFGDRWDRASGVIEGLLAGTMIIAIVGLAVLPFALILYFAGRVVYRRIQGPLAEQPVVRPTEESVS